MLSDYWWGLLVGMDSEEMSWLFQLDLSEGTVRTGQGMRLSDGQYTYRDGNGASGATFAAREAELSVDGATWSARWADTILLSGFEEGEPVADYPLRDLRIAVEPLTEERSCIGRWVGTGAAATGWEHGGVVAAFVTVDDALSAPFADETLCDHLGRPAVSCESSPRGDWDRPPDSLCGPSFCRRASEGADCDPSDTCNAWYLSAEVAAVGVAVRP